MFLKEMLGLEPVTALFAFWRPWDEHLPPPHSPPERLTLTRAPSDLDRPKPLKPSAGSRPSSFLGCVGPTAEADWDNLNVFWEVIPSAIIAVLEGVAVGGVTSLSFVFIWNALLTLIWSLKIWFLPLSSVLWFTMLPLSLGRPYLPIRTGLVLCSSP